ncbi:MAG: lysine exporter LysO family protein, partial [Candidatus Bathyarchaeota archaeon]|nr:lysine exporter LysO family protein [Candidatus Bathyarchaeota archaeon]
TVRIDQYAPIAFGGATTMDTTLPVIVGYCGSEALITAFASGFTLSLIAPFTITTIAALQ